MKNSSTLYVVNVTKCPSSATFSSRVPFYSPFWVCNKYECQGGINRHAIDDDHDELTFSVSSLI